MLETLLEIEGMALVIVAVLFYPVAYLGGWIYWVVEKGRAESPRLRRWE